MAGVEMKIYQHGAVRAEGVLDFDDPLDALSLEIWFNANHPHLRMHVQMAD